MIERKGMDLRKYYKAIREIETKIEGAYAIVTSLDTPDGGKAGIQSEVPRALAARMVVQGAARLATGDERRAFEARRPNARSRAT
jgi:hypothetical protein